MWYYRLITPDSIEVYPLPDAVTMEDYDRRGRIIEELNDRHGVPDAWMEAGGSWDVAVMEGELHPSVLAQANVHTADEVPSGDIEEP